MVRVGLPWPHRTKSFVPVLYVGFTDRIGFKVAFSGLLI